MECKYFSDFPHYRIWENGVVESNYKFKTNIPCGIWRPVQHVLDKSTGYLIVTLCHNGVRKNKRLHRLLAESFIPNPENKAHVNHIDGDKTNYELTNLEWTTPKENTNHAIDTGLRDLSLNHNRPVLQLDKVTMETIAEYKSLHEAGRVTSTQWQNIWKVCDGRRKSAGGYAWAYK